MPKISRLVPGLGVVVVALKICKDSHRVFPGVLQSIDKMEGEHVRW